MLDENLVSRETSSVDHIRGHVKPALTLRQCQSSLISENLITTPA